MSYFAKVTTWTLSNAGHDVFPFYSSVVVSHTALISSLATAEARCMKLEQQLQHMQKVLSSVKVDKHSKLKEQVCPPACFCHVIRDVAVVHHRHSCSTKYTDSTGAQVANSKLRRNSKLQ